MTSLHASFETGQLPVLGLRQQPFLHQVGSKGNAAFDGALEKVHPAVVVRARLLVTLEITETDSALGIVGGPVPLPTILLHGLPVEDAPAVNHPVRLQPFDV